MIALGRKSVKFSESDIMRNDVRSGDHKKAQLLDNNHNDIKSALTSVPNFIDSSPRQLTYNYTKWVLYPGQIAYGSEPISNTEKTILETSQSSSVNFVSLCTATSHKYMVWVLQILSFNIDNKGADEPTSIKEAMA